MPPAGELKHNSMSRKACIMDIIERTMVRLQQESDSPLGLEERAVALIVANFMEGAEQDGMDPFQAVCALFNFAFLEGHESGHQCAVLQAASRDKDERALAGYL